MSKKTTLQIRTNKDLANNFKEISKNYSTQEDALKSMISLYWKEKSEKELSNEIINGLIGMNKRLIDLATNQNTMMKNAMHCNNTIQKRKIKPELMLILESEYIIDETKMMYLSQGYMDGEIKDDKENILYDAKLGFYFKGVLYLVDMLEGRFYYEEKNKNEINKDYILNTLNKYREKDNYEFETVNDFAYGNIVQWIKNNFEIEKNISKDDSVFLYTEEHLINWIGNYRNSKIILEKTKDAYYEYYLSSSYGYEYISKALEEMKNIDKYKDAKILVDLRLVDNPKDISFLLFKPNEDEPIMINKGSLAENYIESLSKSVLERYMTEVENSCMDNSDKAYILGEYYKTGYEGDC